jgi:membrane protein required for colicin V production
VRRVQWESLNWLDVSIALVLLASGLIAFLTGLLRELVSIAALSLALVVAGLYSTGVAARLPAWIAAPNLRALVAFLGVIAVVWSVVGGLGLLTTKLLPKGTSGIGDRALAFGLGGVKGLALATVVLMVLTVHLPAENRAFRSSRLYPLVIQGSRMFAGLLSEPERAILKSRIQDIPRPREETLEGFV